MADLKDKASTAIDNAAKPEKYNNPRRVDKSKAAVHTNGKKIKEKGKRLRINSEFWPEGVQ